EASIDFDFLAEPNVINAPAIYSVRDTVQGWIDGNPNFGWVITTEGTDDWRLLASEVATQELRPMLEITYWNTGLPGDFNADGSIDLTDVNLLSRGMRGEILDGILDLNADGLFDMNDLTIWVHDLKQTWFGDANLDGQFTSADVVAVFQSGQYEDNIALNSTWADGDWNGDGDFTSRDFALAFQDGGYERGRRTVMAVPEPLGAVLLLAGLPLLTAFVRKRRP
ncbi:MAG: hypothetical protein KDB23_30805, partial [Planctomycetales bacterium]|nr:hypothetical protein [Planctomycetales bacterium]